MKSIDLSPEYLSLVRAILATHVPGLEVRVFGSRVRGATRKTSDLDLAVMTEVPLLAARMADLREAFIESALPFKVDVIDWAVTPERFRRLIAREFVVIQDSPASMAAKTRE